MTLAAELAALDTRCFAPAERWSEALWSDELAAERHLEVQREADAVVAAITVSSLFDDAELLRVMVDPDHRGRGLARGLLTRAMDAVVTRGASRMLLEVRHDNTAALGLYLALGFTEIDRRADYYGAGADAVVMECHLGAAPEVSGGDHER